MMLDACSHCLDVCSLNLAQRLHQIDHLAAAPPQVGNALHNQHVAQECLVQTLVEVPGIGSLLAEEMCSKAMELLELLLLVVAALEEAVHHV